MRGIKCAKLLFLLLLALLLAPLYSQASEDLTLISTEDLLIKALQALDRQDAILLRQAVTLASTQKDLSELQNYCDELKKRSDELEQNNLQLSTIITRLESRIAELETLLSSSKSEVEKAIFKNRLEIWIYRIALAVGAAYVILNRK